MKRIRKWVNQLSVKKKLVFYGYLTITPVLIVICLILLLHNYNNVQQEGLNNDLSGVETLAESLSIIQTDIKDFSTYICINNDIRKLLTADHPEKYNQDAKLWFDNAPMEIIQDMIALKGHIKTIAIYPANGIRPYLRGMDGSVHIFDMADVENTDVYQETVNSPNGMVWKYVPKGSGETYLTNRTDKIVLYREIRDLTQKKTLGFIAIGFGSSYVDDLCKNIVKNKDEAVLILDPRGGVLSETGTIDEELRQKLTAEEFVQQDYKARENHFSYGDYEVICIQKEKSASIVCKIVKKYSMQLQFLDIAYMPLILLFGMLIGLLPLLLIISNVVTRPLSRLSKAINKVSTGDFEQQVIVTTHDEVGQVAECFNRMVRDIKSLIDENYIIRLEEQESELAALQAQINPHFLYNTLDSLYWQAMEYDNEEIAESILALSQLFRLVLNQGRREVTVAQEMELVSRYLQIQKMRFSKRLQYEIHVDESIQHVKIPKLIIQPFVENAIVHGFENVSTVCTLTVTGVHKENEIIFEIRDTGIGMSQNQIDEIWEEEPEAYRKQRIGRYAIKNIRERLQRKYQGNFTLTIQSDVGKGTTVSLNIPYKEES